MELSSRRCQDAAAALAVRDLAIFQTVLANVAGALLGGRCVITDTVLTITKLRHFARGAAGGSEAEAALVPGNEGSRCPEGKARCQKRLHLVREERVIELTIP